jgi:hypothetical protein
MAVQRHIRAGRIQERDGKLYATPPFIANPYGTTGYSVTFRCLLPGDPKLAGSHLAPSQIIEQ